MAPRTLSLSLFPFRGEFRGYSRGSLYHDVIAALAVALLTIPQSIAYSLLAGLPPTAGIYSAIFGTIFTASFGSSRHLISGPSTGVAILLQTSLADILSTIPGTFSPAAYEALTFHLLMQLILLVGVIQIGAACFNVSKLLQFVSRPVILGYFVGIAIAIVINQCFYFVGISSPENQPILRKGANLIWRIPEWDMATSMIGLFGMGSFWALRRCFPRLPHSLLMLIVTSLVAKGLYWSVGMEVATLADASEVTDIAPRLTLPVIDFHWINALFPAALAIAFLAMLEVFSISRHVAACSGQQIVVNQDVFGLGIGNFILSFLMGALPASGSATRTFLNYQVGARTRIAAIGSGLFTAVILFFCWPWVQDIPLAALAALLIIAAPSLVNFKEIRLSLKATREDAAVFILTLISCLIFSLDVAFFLGIGMSLATYLKKSAVPHLVEYAFNSKGRLTVVNPKDEVHRHIRIIGIGGDLYFASADVFQAALQSVAEDAHVRVIVLRLNNVYHMDASMCLAISFLHELLQKGQRFLVISGLTEEVWHVFHRAGLVHAIGLDNLYFTDESNPQFSTWKACLRAQELLRP